MEYIVLGILVSFIVFCLWKFTSIAKKDVEKITQKL